MSLEQCHTKQYIQEYQERQLEMPISEIIVGRIKEAGKRFFANDNISDFILSGEKELLIREATVKFAEVLKSLVIDIDQDPNSEDTAYRLAKMYIKEIMSGRYDKCPEVTAFPNDGRDGDAPYRGMLVIPASIQSMCSHHHQPVWGTAYIGVIPEGSVLGLSKYIRLAQWVARRGTLQEQLCNQIAAEISQKAKTPHVAVFIEAHHGCVVHRGASEKCSSQTSTTVLGGLFMTSETRQEFFNNIQLQKLNSK